MKMIKMTPKQKNNGEHAKQYLNFMITTWGKNMKATKHDVAQYACGDGISSNFILNCISKITVALYRYGLIVNNVVGDGATENRTACRKLATLTVEEVLGDFFTPRQKNILPMDFKIAYRHPIQDNVIIFIGDDMPHLIKKKFKCL